MPRNYRIERNAVVQRWYGDNSQTKNPRPNRSWAGGPVSAADCLGIPAQVNSPYRLLGHCMAWRYGLNRDGYGIVMIKGKQELAHRAVFIQTRGQIPDDSQINHLCNRPYCVQPSHLYAGTAQDNKDDSQIFSKGERLHAPWILLWPDSKQSDEPLLRRLQESNRYDGVRPWEPLERPAQKPLEEFTCPEHDFAITMFGVTSRICRICETSEFEEGMIDEDGLYSLVAELCPVSQTVTSIFQKIMESEFVGKSHQHMRRRAYHRSERGFGMGSHDLKKCSCDYCTRDRATFRAAVQPLLTRTESDLLDVCDRLEPQITAALKEASAEMMEAWAKAAGLNDGHAQTMREHYKDCINSRHEMTRISHALEHKIGYLMYALAEFTTRTEMIEDQAFQQIILGWSLFRMKEQDEQHVVRTVLPVTKETANRISMAWQHQADELSRSNLASEPELHEEIRYLGMMLVKKEVMEHLRYELLGRNSFIDQQPHPHHSCALSIMESGQVQPFPQEFKEGRGFTLTD